MMTIDDITMIRFENEFGAVWLNPLYIASISSEPPEMTGANEQKTMVQMSGCRFIIAVNGDVDDVAQRMHDKLQMLKEMSK